MGWWQITTDNPGISNGLPKTEPKPGERVLYNGDEPATAAGELWIQAGALLTPAQFSAALTTGKLPQGLNAARLARLLAETRAVIEQCYRQEWGRAPYPAEWRGLAAFVGFDLDGDE